jgi:hypothetical protein
MYNTCDAYLSEDFYMQNKNRNYMVTSQCAVSMTHGEVTISVSRNALFDVCLPIGTWRSDTNRRVSSHWHMTNIRTSPCIARMTHDERSKVTVCLDKAHDEGVVRRLHLCLPSPCH